MNHDQSISQRLLDARNGKLSPQELFPWMAAAVPAFFSSFQPPKGPGQLPLPDLVVDVGQDAMPVLITDLATGRRLLGDGAQRLQETPATWALQVLIRVRANGAVINPTAEQLVLTAQHLRLLFREYALVELGRAGGAWVPVIEGQLAVFEVQERIYTIPVYLRSEDAMSFCGKYGGKVEWHPWSAIQKRSLETGTDGVFLQCLLPEQAGLARRYVSRLAGDSRPEPLEEIEQIIAKHNGLCMPADLWPVMSRLDGIWVLTDQKDGAPFATGQVFDMFTSLGLAQAVSAQLSSGGKNGAIAPRFLPAQGLFRWLAQTGLRAAINRGQEPYWIDALHGLPEVMRRSVG